MDSDTPETTTFVDSQTLPAISNTGRSAADAVS